MESVLVSYEKWERGKWRRKALYCKRESVGEKVRRLLNTGNVINVLVGQCNVKHQF